MDLSNREIATLVWTTTIFVWALSKPNVRKSFGQLIKAFCAHQILIMLANASVYILGCVIALSALGIWQWASLKTSLMWSVTFAFVAMFDIKRITEDSMYFRKTLRDIFSATVIIVFIAEFYSFGLLAEMIFMPVLTILTLLYGMSETQQEWAKVKSLSGWILAGIGLFILAYGIRRIAGDFDAVATWATAREFAIPILLSVMFLPFIYLLSIYTTYETVFSVISLKISDPKLLRYAKWQAIRTFGVNLDYLRRWKRHIMIHRPDGREGIKQSIQHMKTVKAREENQPIVPERDGWSPNAAKDFLRKEGLVTGDYYQSLDEWFASSPYLEIGEGIMPDNIGYYLEGDETAVKCLKLVLNVTNPDDSTASKKRFFAVARLLIAKALGVGEESELDQKLSTDKELRETVAGADVHLSRENWCGGIPGGYSLKLTITK